MIRNRIKEHRRVRAGDIIPHELNFRMHPENQKKALKGLYEDIGFARSLLAYETPNGKLKLIDGHLRRELDPDMIVDVEVLDVTEEEALKLLAVVDPLSSMAEENAHVLDQLLAEVDLGPELSKYLQDLSLDTKIRSLVESGGDQNFDSAFFEEGPKDGEESVKCPTCGSTLKRKSLASHLTAADST